MNRVTEATGLRGHALITDAAVELLGLEPSGGVSHSEAFADAGSISGRVFELARSASQTPA
jgi:hypothetical protein